MAHQPAPSGPLISCVPGDRPRLRAAEQAAQNTAVEEQPLHQSRRAWRPESTHAVEGLLRNGDVALHP